MTSHKLKSLILGGFTVFLGAFFASSSYALDADNNRIETAQIAAGVNKICGAEAKGSSSNYLICKSNVFDNWNVNFSVNTNVLKIKNILREEAQGEINNICHRLSTQPSELTKEIGQTENKIKILRKKMIFYAVLGGCFIFGIASIFFFLIRKKEDYFLEFLVKVAFVFLIYFTALIAWLVACFADPRVLAIQLKELQMKNITEISQKYQDCKSTFVQNWNYLEANDENLKRISAVLENLE